MRESGILMHITSLPGPYGVGTMGKEAYRFVDFLKEAGQRVWQILPLNPTGYGDSPYQSCSTYAGNHYLIDLDQLIDMGLLYREEVESVDWGWQADRVDFGIQYNNRLRVLHMAFARYRDEDQSFARFRAENDSWLPDFALFMALKERNGGKPWYEWENALKFRDPKAIENAFCDLAESVQFYCFVQYLFQRQWSALRDYAHQAGLRIIGDVPIYVPLDSVDVWTATELFCLDEQLNPTAVAGCPPDAFTADGQLWGNPLYRWDVMRRDGYQWWMRRLAAAGTRYDVVRLDHFRGFESYWAVPFGDPTARYGQWIKGPGMEFIDTIRRELPQLQLIAEDLGFLTQDVLDLRDRSGFPGMKVLGFAFDSREPSEYLPHTYGANSVCYTGTHDNMTSRQWFDTASQDAVRYAAEYMTLSEQEGYVWGMIRTAFATVSDLCVIPLQDYLDIGAEGRMNFPGTLTAANWTWRTLPGTTTPELAARIRALTTLYGRLGTK